MAASIRNINAKGIRISTGLPPPVTGTIEFWIYSQISDTEDYGTVITPAYTDPAWNSGSFTVDGGFGGPPLNLRVDAMLVDRLTVAPYTLSTSSLDTSFNGTYSFNDPDSLFAGSINFVNGVGLAEVNIAGVEPNETANILSAAAPALGFAVTRTSFWSYDGMTYEYFWTP